MLEETGLRVRVTGYIGVWVDEYAADGQVPDVELINVGYYRAEPVGGDEPKPDPREVSELGWFPRDELPDELAPPGTLQAVLAAVDDATPILDRL